MTVYITHQQYYVPPSYHSLTETNLFDLGEKERQVYHRYYGITRIPYHESSTLDMMHESTKLLPYHAVDYLIHAHTTPVLSKMGTTLVRSLQRKLKLHRAQPFSIAMDKCVSTIRALQVIENLFSHHKNRQALLVCGETVFTQDHRVLPNITITADASAALLLSNQRGHSQLLSTAIHTYGQYSRGVWMDLEQVSDFGTYFNNRMEKVLDEVLAKSGVTKKDIRMILPHNVNIPCWKHFASHYHFDLHQIYLENIPLFSHCFNSDLLINLTSAINKNYLKAGDYYIMATVGVGASFGAALFQHRGVE